MLSLVMSVMLLLIKFLLVQMNVMEVIYSIWMVMMIWCCS